MGKYIVNMAQSGYLPESDPEVCDTFKEAIEAVKYTRDWWLDCGDVTWDKWENLSYLRARDIKALGSLTVGVLTWEGDWLGYGLFIAWSEEEE